MGGGRGSGGRGSLATGPSRGDANDYCQHFVDTGQRPQNFLRDSHLVRTFKDPNVVSNPYSLIMTQSLLS